MDIAIYLFLAFLLLLLNAFFVLAEFAAVKARPSRMEELSENGNKKAGYMLHIQSHLDEFLSVCQLGITFASIGLGFVGEPAFARLISALMGWSGVTGSIATHGIAITISYIFVSFLHIVVGELIPKSLAIRRTDESALMTAYPMRFFHRAFCIPLWVLNKTVLIFFKLTGIPMTETHADHSEGEVKIILEDAENSGHMSFHQLLLIENVLDLKKLKIKDAMRVKDKVKCLDPEETIEENLKIIREFKFSRYPLYDKESGTVSSYVHMKDMLMSGICSGSGSALNSIKKPLIKTTESASAESLLTSMQRSGKHIAAVYDAKEKWTGIITLEDLIEELTGIIEEEYPFESPVYISDHLKPQSVIIDLEGDSVITAVKNGLNKLPQNLLPVPKASIVSAVEQRERLMSSYIGKGLAIPHARIDTPTPFLAFFRLATPIPSNLPGENINIILLLVSPAKSPRTHQLFLARTARIMDSDFFESKLIEASSAVEIADAIKIAELSVIS